MLGYAWLNLGSLVLGWLAWLLPIVNIMQFNKAYHKKNWAVFSLISVSACAISLCMQIFYTNHKVKAEDWSALMDTFNAVASVSALLLVVTLILNTIMVVLYHKKRTKD